MTRMTVGRSNNMPMLFTSSVLLQVPFFLPLGFIAAWTHLLFYWYTYPGACTDFNRKASNRPQYCRLVRVPFARLQPLNIQDQGRRISFSLSSPWLHTLFPKFMAEGEEKIPVAREREEECNEIEVGKESLLLQKRFLHCRFIRYSLYSRLSSPFPSYFLRCTLQSRALRDATNTGGNKKASAAGIRKNCLVMWRHSLHKLNKFGRPQTTAVWHAAWKRSSSHTRTAIEDVNDVVTWSSYVRISCYVLTAHRPPFFAHFWRMYNRSASIISTFVYTYRSHFRIAAPKTSTTKCLYRQVACVMNSRTF